jgi:hypothetical protein
VSLSQFFTFDGTNFVNGTVRVLFSKLSNGTLTDQPVPTDISKIFAMKSPYAPVTGASTASPWVDVGATHAPCVYDRGLTVVEWKIEQRLTAVELVPQEVIRSIKIPAAEFARADLIGLFENGPAQNAIIAATGVSAQEQQTFGQFTDLSRYRVALAAFQPLDAGVVYESAGGPSRPRLMVQTFYRCSLTAENVSVTYSKGEMVTADLTLRTYPEPNQGQNAEGGSYWFEAAGTIT